MRLSKIAFLAGSIGILLVSLAPDLIAAERGRGGCRRGDRIRIEDLDVSPDPIMEGQRIRSWRLKVNLEGGRDCETDIEIREGNSVAGRARNYMLRPGSNDIEIPAASAYRFSGREHCFDVLVDLDGTRGRVDADRRFCARQRPGWTMREPGDRPPSGR